MADFLAATRLIESRFDHRTLWARHPRDSDLARGHSGGLGFATRRRHLRSTRARGFCCVRSGADIAERLVFRPVIFAASLCLGDSSNRLCYAKRQANAILQGHSTHPDLLRANAAREALSHPCMQKSSSRCHC